jgi:magnesium-transporting ATPase (P-type)
MAKKRTTAKKRVTRKPQATRRRENPDATINTLVILLVIVMVLGGLFLYAQNSKKQAAQWQAILQTIAALPAPAPTALPDQSQVIETTAGIDAPKDPLKPAANLAPVPAATAVVRPPSSNE